MGDVVVVVVVVGGASIRNTSMNIEFHLYSITYTIGVNWGA